MRLWTIYWRTCTRYGARFPPDGEDAERVGFDEGAHVAHLSQSHTPVRQKKSKESFYVASATVWPSHGAKKCQL